MPDYEKEFKQWIQKVFAALGKKLEYGKDKDYEIMDLGVKHRPQTLSKGKMAVYAFFHKGKCLKIGKVSQKDNARFVSHHYGPNRNGSTLAGSLLKDPIMQRLHQLNDVNVGDWIKEKCRRIDILMDAKLGPFTLGLVEAILHYRYKPQYEGKPRKKE
jgi:hypothetical protein